MEQGRTTPDERIVDGDEPVRIGRGRSTNARLKAA
jgi:hypothetical protein